MNTFYLFETELFWNIMNVFTVTFDGVRGPWFSAISELSELWL